MLVGQTIEIRTQNGKWVGTYFGKNALTMQCEFGTDEIAAHLMGTVENLKLATYAKRHSIQMTLERPLL